MKVRWIRRLAHRIRDEVDALVTGTYRGKCDCSVCRSRRPRSDRSSQ